jgi:hypothetical protein
LRDDRLANKATKARLHSASSIRVSRVGSHSHDGQIGEQWLAAHSSDNAITIEAWHLNIA